VVLSQSYFAFMNHGEENDGLSEVEFGTVVMTVALFHRSKMLWYHVWHMCST